MSAGIRCVAHEHPGYHCGRDVVHRDPRAKRHDRCPGGLVVCESCVDLFVEFLDEAHNAAAVDAEWKEGG